MPVTNLNDLVAAMAANFRFYRPLQKVSLANAGVGELYGLWRAASFPAQGAIPAAAAVCNNLTLGAVPFPNPTGGRATYLAGVSYGNSLAGPALEIWDRLIHMGGLDATSIASQTVGVDCSVTTDNMVLRRGATDYSDVSWFVSIYTDIGTTAQTLTITYTNQAGTAGQTTTVSLGGASPLNRANRLIQIFTGNANSIRSIESVQLGGSTGVAGNFGITAARRLVAVPSLAASVIAINDWNSLGLPKIEDSACLDFGIWCTTTVTGAVSGSILLVQG